jgi:hypothetical protein
VKPAVCGAGVVASIRRTAAFAFRARVALRRARIGYTFWCESPAGVRT